VDVVHGGEEGGGGEDSDAGNGEEILDRWDVVSEAPELVFEAGGLGLEFLDFLQGLQESVAEEGRDQVMVEGAVCVGQECASPLGDRDAKFDEEAADGVIFSLRAASRMARVSERSVLLPIR
jgi:hypothetical protein